MQTMELTLPKVLGTPLALGFRFTLGDIYIYIFLCISSKANLLISKMALWSSNSKYIFRRIRQIDSVYYRDNKSYAREEMVFGE